MSNWDELIKAYNRAEAACEAFWAAKPEPDGYSAGYIDLHGSPFIEAHNEAMDDVFHTPAPDLRALRDKIMIFRKQDPFAGWTAAPDFFELILADAVALCPDLVMDLVAGGEV